jgi:hypothetical protein
MMMIIIIMTGMEKPSKRDFTDGEMDPKGDATNTQGLPVGS